jgi:hypothetical protein
MQNYGSHNFQWMKFLSPPNQPGTGRNVLAEISLVMRMWNPLVLARPMRADDGQAGSNARDCGN